MARSDFEKRRRARSADDIAKDGEVVRPSLFLLDGLQRAVQAASLVTDATEMRKQAFHDRQSLLENAWRDPDNWHTPSNRPSVTPPTPRQPQPRCGDVDYAQARVTADAAYDARNKRLSEAWRSA